jgi:type IV secretion system protein VirB10
MYRKQSSIKFVFALARCLLWCLILPAVIQAEVIPKGTHLLLRMVNSVSTRTAQPGDYVYMRTASPVVVNNRIVIPVNSYVQGVVTTARRGGRVKGRAQLGLRLETLTLPRGKTVRFSPLLRSVGVSDSTQKVEKDENLIRQGSERGRDAAVIAISAGSGAALGAVVDHGARGAGIGGGAGAAVGLARVLLTRGREVELRSGSSIDVVFNQDLRIE